VQTSEDLSPRERQETRPLLALHPTVGLAGGLALAVVCAAAPGLVRGPLVAMAVALVWALARGARPRRLAAPLGLLASFLVVTGAGLVAGARFFPWLVPDLRDSLLRAASLAVRSLGAVAALQGAAGRADAGDLLAAARQLGLPPLVVSLLFIAWRQFFNFMATARATSLAVRARSGSRRLAPVVLGRAGAVLFERGYERSEKIAVALMARGFRGHLPTRPLPRPPVGQLAAVTVALAMLVAALVMMPWR